MRALLKWYQGLEDWRMRSVPTQSKTVPEERARVWGGKCSVRRAGHSKAALIRHSGCTELTSRKGRGSRRA